MNEPVILSLEGDLDFLTAADLKRRLDSLAHAERAVVDLHGVRYIDSTALSQLLRLQRLRRDAGLEDARLVRGPSIERLLDVAGVRDVFPVFDSVESASAP